MDLEDIVGIRCELRHAEGGISLAVDDDLRPVSFTLLPLCNIRCFEFEHPLSLKASHVVNVSRLISTSID